MNQATNHGYVFGNFRVNAGKRLLLRDGASVPLTPKCFDILLALVESGSELVSKDELMQRVWPDSFVEESNLTYNISMLRKSLGEKAADRQYIITIPGHGYRFVADVKIVGKESDETALEQKASQPSTQATLKNKTSIVASLLVVFVGVLIYWAVSQPKPEIESPSPSPLKSIAVLPFKLLGAEQNGSEMEYLSDGISESLINSLSQLPGVKVIARGSSFQYKGNDADPQEVARVLGVEALVTGKVLRRGEQLQISVELMDARDKTQIWGEQYNRKATDLLSVQVEISREIADKLRLKLTTAEQQQFAKLEMTNPQAYELLLKGRFYWNKGGAESRKKAFEYYNHAIAVDPTYALVFAELAFAYAILGHDGTINPKEAMPKAEAAAMRALDLDKSSKEAHYALAYIRQLAWDWPGAEQEYKRALALNSKYADAYASYALYLSLLGRSEQALAEAERAKELDPLSPNININVFLTLLLAHRYDQAIDILKQMRELDLNNPLTYCYFGSIYTLEGKYKEAIAAYKEAIMLGCDARIYLGYSYAMGGQRGHAEAILNELKRGKEYVSPAELATLYAGLGDKKQALLLLERAYSERDLQLQYIGVAPEYDSLRTEPRFADLLQRIGLPRINVKN